jgi:hypothetical protein
MSTPRRRIPRAPADDAGPARITPTRFADEVEALAVELDAIALKLRRFTFFANDRLLCEIHDTLKESANDLADLAGEYLVGRRALAQYAAAPEPGEQMYLPIAGTNGDGEGSHAQNQGNRVAQGPAGADPRLPVLRAPVPADASGEHPAPALAAAAPVEAAPLLRPDLRTVHANGGLGDAAGPAAADAVTTEPAEKKAKAERKAARGPIRFDVFLDHLLVGTIEAPRRTSRDRLKDLARERFPERFRDRANMEMVVVPTPTTTTERDATHGAAPLAAPSPPAPPPEPEPAPTEDPLSLSVYTLDVPSRLCRLLKDAGIETLGQLQEHIKTHTLGDGHIKGLFMPEGDRIIEALMDRLKNHAPTGAPLREPAISSAEETTDGPRTWNVFDVSRPENGALDGFLGRVQATDKVQAIGRTAALWPKIPLRNLSIQPCALREPIVPGKPVRGWRAALLIDLDGLRVPFVKALWAAGVKTAGELSAWLAAGYDADEAVFRDVIVQDLADAREVLNVLEGKTRPSVPSERSCRVCGCTEDDCSGCIERTGKPCHWVAEDLCSACATPTTDRSPTFGLAWSEIPVAHLRAHGVSTRALDHMEKNGWRTVGDVQAAIREATAQKPDVQVVRGVSRLVLQNALDGLCKSRIHDPLPPPDEADREEAEDTEDVTLFAVAPTGRKPAYLIPADSLAEAVALAKAQYAGAGPWRGKVWAALEHELALPVRPAPPLAGAEPPR